MVRSLVSALALTAVWLIFACASSTPMPQAPKYNTSEGRQCAKECQRKYESCVQAWKYTGSFSSASTDRVNDCRELLGDCYEFCLEDEKTNSP